MGGHTSEKKPVGRIRFARRSAKTISAGADLLLIRLPASRSDLSVRNLEGAPNQSRCGRVRLTRVEARRCSSAVPDFGEPSITFTFASALVLLRLILREAGSCRPVSASARMSSTRQAVIRGPSLTGCGKRPALTPAHHVLFETGVGALGS